MTTEFYRHLDWEFAELGRKPSVPVEINWGNTITKGMVGCYMHNTTPTAAMWNLCNEQLDAIYWKPSGGADIEAGADKDGQYFKYSGVSGNTARHRVDEDDYSWIDMNDNDFTLYSIFKHDNNVTAGWPYLISRSSDGSSGANYAIGIRDEIVDVGEKWEAWVRVGSPRTYSGKEGVVDKLTHMCGNKGRGRRRIWVDGVQGANESDTTNITNSGNLGIGGQPDNTYGVSRGLAGKIYLSVIWNRCLSDAEVKHMYKDPYGFLLPV